MSINTNTNFQLAIYERYYLQAKKENIIWSLSDFALRFGLTTEENADDWDSIPLFEQHGKAIQNILTLEISLYVFRNLPGTWGEVVDNLSNQRVSQINNYREKTGYQIDTGNVIY